jgi:hypothetical protein
MADITIMDTKVPATTTDTKLPAELPTRSFTGQLSDDRSMVQSIFNKLCQPSDFDAIEEAHAFIQTDTYSAIVKRLEIAQTPATKADIAARIAVLVALFPNAAKINLTVFVQQLAEAIGDEDPTIGVLDCTIRKVRTTCKFFPTIFEVLEAMREAKEDIWRLGLQVACLSEHPQKVIEERGKSRKEFWEMIGIEEAEVIKEHEKCQKEYHIRNGFDAEDGDL